MSAVIRLQSADVRFGPVQALHAVDLRIDVGERIALIGANGSGKSTLLRVLHGLVPLARGSLLRDGAARQAMVFQRPFVMRTSAANNVALALWLRGTRWRAAREQALGALARVGLAEVALRNARALSGGQQQRLALARAWCLQPDVLLLDEPTASLDPHAKREVEALMAQFADAGTTLVFASHNLGQVKRLASRVVYLEQGRVLADAPVAEFFDRVRLPELSREADLFVKGETA
ncbi:ABC transporter ATP-binding protein [Ramlibacter tataouinensis]|uniref:Candidate ABC transporter probably involved in tungstate transport, ATP-binding component n=1 Tax=Ramlibacter tataouinensis (strain ATCC BAA-407 / DSM 14655 / LMG 21543 / TTB310) TaxID=365046 RepID=F5Y2P8_RAMTT|nr:phosphate ABC transporter ATP-binding protein [Ramlibacter tataouinensis]AEG92411.1 candidate ABC transporter probably involved in tungstate transport, ATP-binding component [Ramlibacter tataouinensis TTB310]